MNSTARTLINFSVIMFFCLVNSYSAACPSSIAPSAPNSRYTLLDDSSEVLDNKTQLIWQRCSIGQSFDGNTCTGVALSISQQEALSKVASLGNGYRLPSPIELKSLREVTCTNPSINTDIFPNTMSNFYWSNLLNEGYSFYAWLVFYDADSVNLNTKPNTGFARAVREQKDKQVKDIKQDMPLIESNVK